MIWIVTRLVKIYWQPFEVETLLTSIIINWQELFLIVQYKVT